METEASTTQIVFAYLSLIGWFAFLTGYFMSLKYSGLSFFGAGMKHLLPWTHQKTKGRVWATIHWLGLIWIVFCYIYVFPDFLSQIEK